MKAIADLHIHSRYSMATSKDGTPENLDLWARKKGISILGTGDFTHKKWREELKESLVSTGDGFYKLKDERIAPEAFHMGESTVRFVVSGEISCIYKKNGKTRKAHHVIILPGFEAAERFASGLEKIGNIHSDGRPILGLDSRDLLEMMLDIAPEGIFIPAHIWTPHFSVLGEKSGFDSIEECFEDLTPYIHALETGLSSDPPMNWRVSALDRYQLVSNSDAHSPPKLGREANLLDTDLSYAGLYNAIQKGEGLLGTVEFFPEEGKYHYDGHRKCGVCLSPEEAEACDGICPVCGKKLTMGVGHRIEQLADRKAGYVKERAKKFESLVPLSEVISSCMGYGTASKKVQSCYEEMLKKLGAEFEILRQVPVEDIAVSFGEDIAGAIGKIRAGEVKKTAGYDGEYGKITY
ncbi:MAG: endonuclease Q family protein [Blautia sp.]|nr:endonuclease Q family protein [Blautia sp.]